jgi:hypothetical protein
MPGFTVTRGLGPGATPTNLIARGFLPQAALEVIRIVRAGRSAASRAIKDVGYNFRISAMLVAQNGRDFVSPISKNIRKTFDDKEIIIKKVATKSIETRKSNDITVVAQNVKVRNKKNV